MNFRKMMTAAFALAFALLLAAGTAPAQTSATNGASLTVTPSLALTPVADLLFPDVLSGAGEVAQSQAAEMTLDSDPQNDVSISVSVPDSLLNGTGAGIPLSYGVDSAREDICDSDGDGLAEGTNFDPTAAAPQIPSCVIEDDGSGPLRLGIGNDVTSAGSVVANVGTVPAATYTGTITWTVALN